MSILTMCKGMINASNRNKPVNKNKVRIARALPYSPIFIIKAGQGNKITAKSIIFEGGERLKRCPKCEEWLPCDTINFIPAKSSLGLSSYCRPCDRARFRTAKIIKRNT